MKVISENFKLKNEIPAIKAYLKLSKEFSREQLFLLESLSGPYQDNQKSMIGFNPVFTLKISKSVLHILGVSTICNQVATSLDNCEYLIKKAQHKYEITNLKNVWNILRTIEANFSTDYISEKRDLAVGFLGYFGYDAVHYVEDLPYIIKDNPDSLPDVILSIYQGIYYIEANNQAAHLTINNFVEVEPSLFYSVDEIVQIIDGPDIILPNIKQNDIFEPNSVSDSITKKTYLKSVKQALEYIAVGDIYQVQIGHEITIDSAIDPFLVYLRKRLLNPSPYMYFAQMEGVIIIGASPELFVRIDNNMATVRPIAGTIKRGTTVDEDNLLKQQLASDTKEQAEHLMLVDLSRNDIGRICKVNSLQVTDLMLIEKYSHVFHMVSNVIGTIDDTQYDKYDVIAANFPAGTVTGAPKVRAMEIIEEIESSRRQLYAGMLGFIDFGGNIETALCIRTSFYKNGVYHIRACAGIVADSNPEFEWTETLSKLSSSYKAITGKELKHEDFIS